MIPNCAATRHAHFHLDGSGPVMLDPPSLDAWPKLTYDVSTARRVNLDTVTHDDVKTWKPGEVLLLSGKLLTGRDAAHKRMTDMLNRGETLPVDLTRPLHLLRRPRRRRPRRSRRPRRPHHRHPHGQVHPPDAREHRPPRHGRQSRTRPRRHRSHPRQRSRLPHGRRRSSLPRLQSHQEQPASSPSKTSAWKPSTSSTSRTCPSP